MMPVEKASKTRRCPETDRAMERYSAGEDAAFALLYDSLAPRILSYLLRRTNDRGEAEDLLQQTMLQIHRSRGGFIAGAEVTPWAFAIARHLLVDRSRHSEPTGPLDAHEWETRVAEEPDADDLVHAHRLAVHIEHALAELPDSQRRAFQLVKEDGLSFGEAANVLGTTVGAAKARAQRAYKTLRSELAAASMGLRRGRW